jgi:2-methoxy-6-polyprenyl-1,4-benzoquinol methylase
MNDLMSGGIHRLWKDEFVNMMGIQASAARYVANNNTETRRIPRLLDVAGGTGDISFRVAQQFFKHFGSDVTALCNEPTMDETLRQIVVCDINPEMLAVGKSRAPEVLGHTESNLVGFVEGNAEKLPFESNSFDFYTIAFGLRNVTNKQAALNEAYRVLRPGGRLLVLEFSHLENPLMQAVYDQYSFTVIPKLGQVIANDSESYQYLVESIRRFPKQEELKQMFIDAGFNCVVYTNMTFGVVAVHSGFKLK